MPRIGFVTFTGYPIGHEVDEPAVRELRNRNIAVDAVMWDKPDTDLTRYDALILRSCWNYHLHIDAFRGFLDRVESLGVPLWNPLGVVRWNLDKDYLRDLWKRGVRLPRTAWVEPGQTPDLPTLLRENGLDAAVIKPAVSANAYLTFRTTLERAPEQTGEWAAALASGRVLVQQFLPQVQTAGEVSLIYFNGQFSHAVIKHPKAGDFRVQETHGGSTRTYLPSAEIHAQVRSILECIDSPLLYARLDGVIVDGQFLLMEAELIEPELYFKFDELSAVRFADAVQERLNS